MAAGDITWFRRALLDIGLEVHQLETDTLKLALIDSVTTPSATTADPRWGAGGTTDFSARQVSPVGGTYTTGGATLQISAGGAGTQTWTLVSDVPTLRADAVTWAQNASNPTNARWGIIYNDTAAGKQCLAFVDLGSVRDLTAGALTVDWSGANNDILTITTP